MNNAPDAGLRRCAVCEVYLRKDEGFTCPKCRRGPLCKTHRAPGKRECASCVFEMISKELHELREQETGIRNFLRLLQFLFLVFAILFISLKVGLAEMVEFLSYSIVTDSTGFLGALSVLAYILFYIILYSQRTKIRELESRFNDNEFRRMIK